MKRCIVCGSHAINQSLHGRNSEDLDLCDVCYWRKRADENFMVYCYKKKALLQEEGGE